MAGKPYEAMIDVARAAEMMGISAQEVRAMVYGGQLRAIAFAGPKGNITYRFRPSDVELAMERHREGNEWSGPANWPPLAPEEPEEEFRLPRKERRRIVIDLARARELRERGMDDAAIGQELGASASIVAQALRTGKSEFLGGQGRPRVWFDVAQAIESWRAGKTFDEIAAEIGGLTGVTVRKAVREAAPGMKKPTPFRDHDSVKRMTAMRRKGATYNEIGIAFGLTGQQVQHGFKVLGIRTPPVYRAPRAQFDVARAVEMRRSGMSFGRIAKEFGLSPPTVTRAIRENTGLSGSMFAFDIDLAMKMRLAGYGFAEISKAVAASRPTVTNAIKLRMLTAPVSQSHPAFNVARAMRMRRSGMSYRAIGEAMGVPGANVRYRLKDLETETDLTRIPRFNLMQARLMLRKGASLVEIAERYGMSVSAIAHELNPHAIKEGGPEAPGEGGTGEVPSPEP